MNTSHDDPKGVGLPEDPVMNYLVCIYIYTHTQHTHIAMQVLDFM